MTERVSASQFGRKPTTGATVVQTGLRALDAGDDQGRSITYILSDESVARDGHTIATSGWDLSNFNGNPVMLWAHDTTAPPIGRWSQVWTEGSRLMGRAEYADAETYPFADTIYRLVKGKYLNAVSVSWLPLEWKYTSDKRRPGGVDFKRQELLEVSQVPVPCLPSALATARANGIDTSPLREWAERVLDDGAAILVPAERRQIEKLRKECRMPQVIRPRTAAAAPPVAIELEPATIEPVATIEPIVEPDTTRVLIVDGNGRSFTRDLSTTSLLADLVQWLAWVQMQSAWETESEGDGSPVPGMLADSLADLGAILIAMTTEEVGELLASLPTVDEDPVSDTDIMTHAARILARAYARKSDDGVALVRSGRVLSGENARCLQAALDHHEAGAALIRGILEKNTAPDTGDDAGIVEVPDDTARAAATAEALEVDKRKRKARVAQLRTVAVPPD